MHQKNDCILNKNKGWELPGVYWTELCNMGCPEAFSACLVFLVFQAANIDTVHTIKTSYRFNRNWNGLNVSIRHMKN